MTKKATGILLALLAAALYAVNAPLSKLLLAELPATFMAGFLYIGAGSGMAFVLLIRKLKKSERKEMKLTAKELPYTVAMILLDIAAPICLMVGLKTVPASGASLLNNFEIVMTAIIAFAVFKEKISPRLWLGILLITVACGLLSLEDIGQFRLSWGALLILLAGVCWGFENNCTRKLSGKDPMEIVLLKGIFSGIGSCVIALIVGEKIERIGSVFAALAVGMVAYGFSIFVYVYAQRLIGAARTSAYYAVAPFIGMALSLVILREAPSYIFYIALVIMAAGAWFAAQDQPVFLRRKRKNEHEG